MEGQIRVPREKCMKISFAKDPKIMEMFGKPPFVEIEEKDGVVTIYTPIGYEINREFHGFKVREFHRVFKALEVENGRKIWRHDRIILEPKKTAKVLILMAPGEHHLLQAAAEMAGEPLSEYIRAAALTRMARELGLY